MVRCPLCCVNAARSKRPKKKKKKKRKRNKIMQQASTYNVVCRWAAIEVGWSKGVCLVLTEVCKSDDNHQTLQSSLCRCLVRGGFNVDRPVRPVVKWARCSATEPVSRGSDKKERRATIRNNDQMQRAEPAAKRGKVKAEKETGSSLPSIRPRR